MLPSATLSLTDLVLFHSALPPLIRTILRSSVVLPLQLTTHQYHLKDLGLPYRFFN